MQNERAQVVLTGGTGFVGRQVVRALLKRGYQPWLVTRPDSDLSALKELEGWQAVSAEKVPNSGLRPVAWLELGWHGVAGKERDNPQQLWGNLPRILDHIKLASNLGCKYWLGLGSQAEYGNPNKLVSEDYLPQPTTLYGKSKLACAHASQAACEALQMKSSWLRLFSAYGPGDQHGFIPFLMRQFSQGIVPQVTACEQRWDYLFVEDVASAIVRAMECRIEGIYNLGSGEAVVMRQVVEAVRSMIGEACPPAEYGAVPYRADQIMHMQADMRRFKLATGWTAKIGLAEGISRTLQAWKHENSH